MQGKRSAFAEVVGKGVHPGDCELRELGATDQRLYVKVNVLPVLCGCGCLQAFPFGTLKPEISYLADRQGIAFRDV
ncbi:MAG: hypothetical protein M9937_25195 [Chelatococcus sp.]|nr:hypothetical protein [Chelatococcus sp.]MCO5078967.1 hypothetical protein [Chelatococcus sp.]